MTKASPGHGVRAPTERHDAFAVWTPGRVNLIGEHTDYNDGLVLPMAIERGLRLSVRRRPDRLAVLASDREAAKAGLDLDGPLVPGRKDWIAYPQGVIEGFRRLGWRIPGFEAVVSGNLPAGGGVSSSAALEVATATAIETLCGRSLDPDAKALLCRDAEHEFAGVPCGIMDQFAVTLARAGHALLLDCRSREIRHVPLDGDDVCFLVVNSGVKHALADGEYARRRAECASAAALLGRGSLRDVTPDDWERDATRLPPLERRRAAHVLTENERVRGFVDAVARRDWPRAGALMRASHDSLAVDYEVSCRELDLLVAAACGLAGVFGFRMTGGGFGGCAVGLVQSDRAADVMADLASAYRAATGIDADMFVTSPSAGVHVEPA